MRLKKDLNEAKAYIEAMRIMRLMRLKKDLNENLQQTFVNRSRRVE